MKYFTNYFCFIILLLICLTSAEVENKKDVKATTNTCVKSQLTAMIISFFAGYTGADRYYL